MNPGSWIALAIILTVAEFFVPGLVIIWFAIGAFLTSLIVLAGVENIYLQFASWMILSGISLYFGIKYVRTPLLQKNQQNKSFEEPQGLKGKIDKDEDGYKVVLEKPYHGISKWNFRFSENFSSRKPKSGMKVKVVGVDGIALIVEPVSGKSSPESSSNKL